MKKVMLIFGTRPEAIKMCPLVLELKRRPEFETVVCVTGQHREMLDQILQCFQVTPQYDLSIMRDKQTLFDVTVNILEKLRTDIYNFTYTNGNTQFSYYYQDLYRGINFTNQVLEYAPKIPAENIYLIKFFIII